MQDGLWSPRLQRAFLRGPGIQANGSVSSVGGAAVGGGEPGSRGWSAPPPPPCEGQRHPLYRADSHLKFPVNKENNPYFK